VQPKVIPPSAPSLPVDLHIQLTVEFDDQVGVDVKGNLTDVGRATTLMDISAGLTSIQPAISRPARLSIASFESFWAFFP